MTISFSVSGDFKKTERYLLKLSRGDLFQKLDRLGRLGVESLSRATPVDTGKASQSWGYRVIKNKNKPGIEWYNDNVENGAVVAILIQYGHGTKNGGYVQGRDYINPAMRPVFDFIAEEIWKEVKS